MCCYSMKEISTLDVSPEFFSSDESDDVRIPGEGSITRELPNQNLKRKIADMAFVESVHEND